MVIGQGWDERAWPDPRPPTRAELDRAGGGPAGLPGSGRRALGGGLDRAAGPAARVATRPGSGADGLAEPRRAPPGPRPDGPAVHRRRTAGTPPRAALSRGRAQGVGDGARARRTPPRAARGPGPGRRGGGRRSGWRWSPTGASSAGRTRSPGRAQVGAAGLAGDLCVDGAIGSRTAALREPYADADHRGVRYLTDDEITDHLVACTRRGSAGRLPLHRRRRGRRGGRRAPAGRGRSAGPRGPGRPAPAGARRDGRRPPTSRPWPTSGSRPVCSPAFDAAWGGPGSSTSSGSAGARRRDEPVRRSAPGRRPARLRHRRARSPRSPAGRRCATPCTHWRPEQRLPVGRRLRRRDPRRRTGPAGSTTPGMLDARPAGRPGGLGRAARTARSGDRAAAARRGEPAAGLRWLTIAAGRVAYRCRWLGVGLESAAAAPVPSTPRRYRSPRAAGRARRAGRRARRALRSG